MRRRWLTVPIAMVLVAAPAFPCGGSGADIGDRPLVSATRYLSRLVDDDEYETALRLELETSAEARSIRRAGMLLRRR